MKERHRLLGVPPGNLGGVATRGRRTRMTKAHPHSYLLSSTGVMWNRRVAAVWFCERMVIHCNYCLLPDKNSCLRTA